MRYLTFTLLALTLPLVTAAKTPRGNRMPKGTTIRTSHQLADDSSADNLIDGDKDTFLLSAQGTAGGDGKKAASVFLRFPEPVEDLVGMVTGAAEKYGNYYARKIEFYADSTGDKVYDTFLGTTTNLGPGKKSHAEHLFIYVVPRVHGLEMRVVEHSVKGAKRAFSMNELELLIKRNGPKKAGDTPVRKVLGFPADTKVKASYKTDGDAGPDKLIDGDCTTFTRGAGNTAGTPDKPAIVSFRFPKACRNLAGIQTGRADKFGNYNPETIEVWIDRDGHGKFKKQVATIDGLGPNEESRKQVLFAKPVKAYGIQLRVTKQNMKGLKRAFTMDELKLIVGTGR